MAEGQIQLIFTALFPQIQFSNSHPPVCLSLDKNHWRQVGSQSRSSIKIITSLDLDLDEKILILKLCQIQRVLVSVAYMPEVTDQEELTLFQGRLSRWFSPMLTSISSKFSSPSQSFILSTLNNIDNVDSTSRQRYSIIWRLGAEVRLFPIGANDVCDCVSLALWLRNLAYQVLGSPSWLT